MAGGVGSRAGKGWLPAEVSSFVDRVDELAEAKRLLSTARLVTLTGVGGTGKSRLAVRVAMELGRRFADGVWLVELAPLTDGRLVEHAVAETLGVVDPTDQPLRGVLAEHLRHGELLLVLDSCEHLLDACAALAESLLREAPDLRILCTSRQPLGMVGETVLTVRPLPVPDPAQPLPASAATQFAALALFADRAAAAAPGFTLTPDVQDLVVEVCRRLDGLPLAIELAAAQLRTVSLRQLSAGLNNRFQTLAARHALPAHHRRLQLTFDWSYDLCSPAEQTLWGRLSVFAGSFNLDAVTAVCGGGGLGADDLLDVLAGLVDKSVLIRETQTGQVRYRLLDTVRQYGLDRFEDAGEVTALRRRHRDWYLNLAEQFDAEWFGPNQRSWSGRIRAEHDNFRAALGFCLSDREEAATGLRFAVALRYYWLRCGAVREGRYWLDATLAADPTPSVVRVQALVLYSAVLISLSGPTLAADIIQQGLDLAERLGAPAQIAEATAHLGITALYAGDLSRAEALLQQALARLAALGTVSETVALTHLALATTALDLGQVDRAVGHAAEARAYCQRHGDRAFLATALYGSAIIALAQGDARAADEFLRECLPMQQLFGDSLGMVIAFDIMAMVAVAEGDHQRAAWLLGVGMRMQRIMGRDVGWTRDFRHRYRGAAEQAHDALGADGYEAAVARGADLTVEQAVRDALGQDTGPAATATSQPGPLTRREREVAELIAEGLSNKQIAARLLLSQRTAESHVENILRKLGFSSRTRVAAWIAEQRRH